MASYVCLAFVMTLREAEMEGHWHCCPNVALMCPCCPIVNFKHSAHVPQIASVDTISLRKENIIIYIYNFSMTKTLK